MLLNKWVFKFKLIFFFIGNSTRPRMYNQTIYVQILCRICRVMISGRFQGEAEKWPQERGGKENRLGEKKVKRGLLQQMQVRNYIETSMTLPLAWFPTQKPLDTLTTTTIYSYNLRKSYTPHIVHTEGETRQDVHRDAADRACNIVISHTLL